MTHKQVIVVRKDLNMRKGKLAAQVAHASMAAILNQGVYSDDSFILELDERIKPWLLGNFKKICVSVNSEEELINLYQQATTVNVISCLITDNGLTEFNGVPTKTAVAIGPDRNEVIDLITKHLPLI